MRDASKQEITAIGKLSDFAESISSETISLPPPRAELLMALESEVLDCQLISWHILDRMDSKIDLDYLGESTIATRNVHEYSSITGNTVAFRILGSGSPADSQNLSIKSDPPDPFASSSRSTSRMTIIIHGTWAARYSWWRPYDNLWWYLHGRPNQGIRGHAEDVYDGSSPFSWSGKNDDVSRKLAASELMKWCKNNPTDSLQVIAHSHGGNVAMLAAHMGLEIDRLILLGTPIRYDYLPPTESAPIIKNVISIGDRIQGPGTIPRRRGEGRTLSESANTSNFIAHDDGNGGTPGHSDLHHVDCWKKSGITDLLR